MQANKIFNLSMIAILMVSMAVSCKKPGEDTIDFNKENLLENIANNQIAPAINDFAEKVSSLQFDYTAFQANPTTDNFETVRDSWKLAYVSWQTMKIFDFGPMRDYALKGSIGTFPTDTTKVLSNIASGSYTLGTAANIDAVGLSSLDFLLYRNDALTFFTSDNNYMQYGLDVIQKMNQEISAVQAQWETYKSTFIASTGTETTSAFSLLVNEFNRDYELAKNAKLGIPIGKQSLEIQLPEYIEARYSGISLDLLKSNLEALRNLYTGGSGVGFDDYLEHLDRGALNSTIRTNFNTIISLIEGFSGTLEQEMQTNVSGLNELYVELQGQVVNLKTDMTSAFGILITYQDNDGD